MYQGRGPKRRDQASEDTHEANVGSANCGEESEGGRQWRKAIERD